MVKSAIGYIFLLVFSLGCQDFKEGFGLDQQFAPNISYSDLTFFVGDSITLSPVAPATVTNVIYSCTITPALPSGLSIHNRTCVISGATTLPISSVLYNVTASNRAGSVTTTVTLTAYEFKGIRPGSFGDSESSSTFDINPDYTTSAPATFKDQYFAMALQPDGKVLVAGATSRAYDSGPLDGFIARLNTDGSLDTSFNSTGKYIYNGTWGYRDYLYDVITQDGKIYGFGSSRTSTAAADSRGILFKLNLDGSLDTSFGMNGVATIFQTSNSSYVSKGVVLADGKIVILGVTTIATVRYYFVAKFNVDGTIDTTFGTSGISLFPSVMTSTERDLVIDPMGRILVTVLLGGTTDYKTNVFRLTSNGTLDTTWGVGGYYTLSLGELNYPRNFILKDDVLLVAGQHKVGADWYPYLVKIDGSGAPITSWGVSGILDLSLDSAFAGTYVQSTDIYSNQIICAGNTATNFQLFSLDYVTGDLINIFGTNGFFTGTSGSPILKLSGVKIDSINKVIWAAGTAATSSSNTLMLSVKLK